MSRFVINDIELSIPPTDINVNKRALNKEIYSLRSPLPNQTKVGKADIEVTFSAVFTSIDELNRKLRPLVAQIRLTPFMYVENEYLRTTIFPQEKDRHRSMALTLRSLVIEASSGAPGTVFAHFDCLYFNYLPYTPDFKYRQSLFPVDGIVRAVTPGESEPWKRFYTDLMVNRTTPMNPAEWFDPGIVLFHNEYAFGLKEETRDAALEVVRQQRVLLDMIQEDSAALIRMVEDIAAGRLNIGRFQSTPEIIRGITAGREEGSGPPAQLTPEEIGRLPLIDRDEPANTLFENVIRSARGKTLNPESNLYSLAGQEYSIPQEVENVANLLRQREKLIRERSSLSELYKEVPNVSVDDGNGLIYGLFKKETATPLVPREGVVVTDIRIEFRNQIAVIPLAGHVYSTHQYMGGDPARLHIGMKVLTRDALEQINTSYETVESNARTARFFPQSILSFRAENNFLSLFGLNKFLTETLQMSASSQEPGTYTGTMSLVEVGAVAEELKQEKIVTTDVARKQIINVALKQFINIEHRDDVITALGGSKWVIQNKFTDRFLGQFITGLGATGKPIAGKEIQARVTGQLLTMLERALRVTDLDLIQSKFFESLVETTRSFSGDFTNPRSGIVVDPAVFKKWRILRIIDQNDVAKRLLAYLTDDDIPGLSIVRQIYGKIDTSELQEARAINPNIPLEAERAILADQANIDHIDHAALLEKARRSEFFGNVGINVDNPLSTLNGSFAGLSQQAQLELLNAPSGAGIVDPRVLADSPPTRPQNEFVAFALDVNNEASPFESGIPISWRSVNDLVAQSPTELMAKLLTPITDALVVWADMIIGTGLYRHMDEFASIKELGLKGGALTYRDFPNLSNLLTSEQLTELGVAESDNVLLDPDFYFFNYMLDRGLFQDFLTEEVHARQTETNLRANTDPAILTNFKSTYLQNYLSPRAFSDMLNNYQSVTGQSEISLQNRDGDQGTVSALDQLKNTSFHLDTFGDSSTAIKTIIKPETARRITDRGSLFSATQLQTTQQETGSPEADGERFRSPLAGNPQITSRFDSWESGLRTQRHEAVDYGVDHGTPVYAIADGVIDTAHWQGGVRHPNGQKRGGGFIVSIDHQDGHVSSYMHLEPSYYVDAITEPDKWLNGWEREDEIRNLDPRLNRNPIRNPYIRPIPTNVPLPQAGQPVVKGQLIGFVGSTGSSTGPHLHLQVKLHNQPIDPLDLFNGHGSMPKFDLTENVSRFDLSFKQLLHEVVNQQGMRVVRAYPTFKLYFIEPDQYEDPYSFDDFFSYNSVEEITLIQDRNIPADLCYIRLSNISGILSNRKWGENAALDPITGRVPRGDNSITQPDGKPGQEHNLDPKRNNTELENPIASLLLKEGTHIELRLGYANDPDRLEPKFVGKVTAVNLIDSDDLVELVCQSFGAELVQDIKGTSDDGTEVAQRLGGGGLGTGQTDGTTSKLLTRMISEPEIRHFGRYNKVVAYNSPNRKLLVDNWRLNEDVNDDNIFVPKDFFLLTGTGRFGSAKAPVSERVAGEGDPFLRFSQGQLTDTDQLIAFGDDDSKPPSYWLYRTTVWDVFKEMELRHPGWIAQPVYYLGNYGPRMTMFFGMPDQLYFARDQSMEEAATLSRLSDLVDKYNIDLVEENLNLYEYGTEPDVNKVRELVRTAIPGDVPAEVVSADAGSNKKQWVRRLSEVLATRISSRGPQIRPFRKYHLLTSEHHIIKNDMSVTRQNVFNVATVQYSEVDEFDEDLNQFTYDDTDQSVSIKVDAALPDDEAQEVFIQYPSCQTKALAQRYGLATLYQNLKGIYQGSIVAIGNPSISPHDICFVNDKYSNIVGAVEVDRVVHTLSRDTGYIMEIKPSMICHVNEVNTMVSKDLLGIMAASIYNRMSNLFSLGAPNNMKLTNQTIDPKLGGAIMLNPSLEKWGEMELNEFANLKTGTYTNFAHPILFSPVLYHGRPWLAGVSADKIKSKAWYTRFGEWLDAGQSGLEKRLTDWHSVQNVERLVRDDVSGDPTVRERIQEWVSR